MADDLLLLPEELILEILNRLPSESLLRFTSVCKSWYSLITSPRFINTHLLTSSVENQVFLRHRCFGYGSDKYSIHRDNEAFDKLSDFDLPFHDSTIRIIYSCNGLICMYVSQRGINKQNVYLWNPCIRRFFQVPQPPVDFEWITDGWGTIGFGFSPETNDYKIVNFCKIMPGKAGVYELSIGSWKNINNSKEFFKKYGVKNDAPQSFLNDTIHWVGHEFKEDLPWMIVTFDMKRDELGVLMVPSSIDNQVFYLHVMLFQDSLALMQFVATEEGGAYCCIWVMNEYGVYDSWTKHFMIDLNFGLLHKPLVFRHNGDALLTRSSRPMRDLVSYDPKNENFKNLGINASDIVYADYFVQSLVLLEKPAARFSQN